MCYVCKLPSVTVWIMSQPILTSFRQPTWTSFRQPKWTSFSQTTWTSLSLSVQALLLPHCRDYIQKIRTSSICKVRNEWIPCNSNILATPIFLTLNLKFLYESTVIHSLSFSPHSHHCPPLLHITALLSPHSYHCPHLRHITVLPSPIRINILEGVYVQNNTYSC